MYQSNALIHINITKDSKTPTNGENKCKQNNVNKMCLQQHKQAGGLTLIIIYSCFLSLVHVINSV